MQYSLLESNSKLLNDKGIILYSTCTLNTKENTKLVNRFIKNHEGYRIIEEDTIINDMGDCFYYAVIEKE